MSIEGTQGPASSGAAVTDIRKFAANKAEAPSGQQERTDSTDSTDSTGITDDARELGRAREAVESSGDVRTDRVEALRTAIANGTYEADPGEVARKLLDRGFDSP